MLLLWGDNFNNDDLITDKPNLLPDNHCHHMVLLTNAFKHISFNNILNDNNSDKTGG